MAEAPELQPVPMDVDVDDWIVDFEEIPGEQDNFLMFLQEMQMPADLPEGNAGQRRAFAAYQFRRHMAQRRVVWLAREATRQRSAAGNVCDLPACRSCAEKKIQFGLPGGLQFRFVPTTLKQRILLEWVYKLFDGNKVDQIDTIPLPELLLGEIKQGCAELKRYREQMGKLIDTINCYHRDIIWCPDSTRIDERRTAEMIVLNNTIPLPRRFKLAAHNCLEEKIAVMWEGMERTAQNLFLGVAVGGGGGPGAAGAVRMIIVGDFLQAAEPIVRRREITVGSDQGSSNPLLQYWIRRCSQNDLQCPSLPAKAYLHGCIKYAIERNRLDLLEFFMRQVADVATFERHPEDLIFAQDHFFHIAVEISCAPAAVYIWQNSELNQRESILSAMSCCGAKNGFHAFQIAVSSGFLEMVKFLWAKTDDRQHNTMLLTDHCAAFCTAASNGYTEIVKLLWCGTSRNQKFVMLFEQNCKALRGSCAGGHMEIVSLLWADVLPDQRKQMMSVCNYEVIRTPTERGHIAVVKYLWDECTKDLSDDICRFFLNCVLRPALAAAASKGNFEILRFLESSAKLCGEMGVGFLQRALVGGDFEVITGAASGQHWDVVEWLSTGVAESDKAKFDAKVLALRQKFPLKEEAILVMDVPVPTD